MRRARAACRGTNEAAAKTVAAGGNRLPGTPSLIASNPTLKSEPFGGGPANVLQGCFYSKRKPLRIEIFGGVETKKDAAATCIIAAGVGNITILECVRRNGAEPFAHSG